MPRNERGGLYNTDVIVMAGGLGTRLASVLPDRPKVLAPIGEATFLDYFFALLKHGGARRLVLSLGHLADQVLEHVRKMENSTLEIDWVIEPEPQGTAGALRLARSNLLSDPILVLNGDTWLTADFESFLEKHKKRKMLASILSVFVQDTARYGRIEMAPSGTVKAFKEKEPSNHQPGYINAGAILLSQDALELLMESKGPSLERDFLSSMPPESIGAEVDLDAKFVDIGTPESFAEAFDIISQTGIGPFQSY